MNKNQIFHVVEMLVSSGNLAVTINELSLEEKETLV